MTNGTVSYNYKKNILPAKCMRYKNVDKFCIFQYITNQHRLNDVLTSVTPG